MYDSLIEMGKRTMVQRYPKPLRLLRSQLDSSHTIKWFALF